MYITADDIEKEISFYYPIDNRLVIQLTIDWLSSLMIEMQIKK